MTFWHSFVGMIHYDDVSVQDNTEEITGHDHTAKCCNTVIGWQDFLFLFVCVLVVNCFTLFSWHSIAGLKHLYKTWQLIF